VKLFTIGFTKTTAEKFFSRLQNSGAKKLVDVRLNNVSQLAGFAKRDDLRYFADRICRMEYEHVPALAPTQEMLDEYKKGGGAWEQYASKFLALMSSRHIESLDRKNLDAGCLLCSEDKPHHCHRRLVAEYLRDKWPDVEIVHL
jgi:uncharacterized protein (DUF488 family)